MRALIAVLCASVLVLSVSAAGLAADTKVGPRGQFYVNGKAVVPLGVWQQPEYLFAYHRHLGMNCLVWPPGGGRPRATRPGYLIGAAKAGLGAIVHYEPNLVPMPATWGWISSSWTPDKGAQRYRQLRQADPNHVVMVNFPAHELLKGEQAEFAKQAVRNTDCVVSHVWPEMLDPNHRNLRNVGDLVDRIRRACKDRPGGEVSIWPDINPHLWTLQKARGGTLYPAPTPAELRFQVWLALIHGADGICFFPISFDPFVWTQIPAKCEQELGRTSRLVQRFAEALTAEESPLKIKLTGTRKGGVVDFTTRRLKGNDYVFVVNGQAEPQTVRMEAEGLGTERRLHDAIGDKPVPASGGAHEEKLGGLELRIWRIEPAAEAAD
ncbi:MAG TPA: hypothetical protein VNA25_02380 [Phycisphaerae bacterium]|nr:hypothetical protein [Phycisphaerae bacterium]